MPRTISPFHARAVVSVGVAVLLVSACVGTLWAGPLSPPVGPVTGTYKTLVEVEPRTAVSAANTPGDADSLFKITQPGSYYLTGNITGVAGFHGVEIAASGVTLDLNGFDLAGVAGSLDGVTVTLFAAANIAVINGSVRAWGGDGVDLSTSVTDGRIANVLANGNGGNGISTGPGNLVTNCAASFNTGNGINAYLGCTVSNCSGHRNTGNGISANGGSTVTNCSAFQNSLNGIDVSLGGGCAVIDCNTRANTLDGIRCFYACTIRGNTCSDNGLAAGDGAGIHATNAKNRIEGNTCTGADRGIDVDLAGNIIVRNVCSGNMVNNWDVVAGNAILVINATVTVGAVTGNSGGVAPGSTDPSANFTY